MVASCLQWVLSYTQPWIVTHISTVDDIKYPDVVTTPLGLFLRMPFGYEMQLTLIDQVSHGLHFCYAYTDDLLIAKY